MTSTGLRSRFGIAGVAAVAACGFLAVAALAASTNFSEFATSPESTGSIPVTVAAADLDGDLDPDLSVTDAALDRVTVLRNR